MTHALVPSDRIEGAVVCGRDGRKIGTVERLMLDKATGQVAYAVVKTGGLLDWETHHYPVAWEALVYNRDHQRYELEITLEELRASPCELDGDAFDWGDRSPPYHHPHYWGV